MAKRIIDREKLVMCDPAINDRQLEEILSATPAKYIKKLPGRNQFDYVPASYVTRRLNHIFGWKWNFVIIGSSVEEKSGKVHVQGSLTIITESGLELTRQQFGSSVNEKDKYKSAASDALKKCASMFGVAQDVYGQIEGKEYEIVDSKESQEAKDNDADYKRVLKWLVTNVNSEVEYNVFTKSIGYQRFKDDEIIKQLITDKCHVWNH